MLQEASGAAGHPSYRRYHYGSGPLLVEDGATRRFISTDALGSTTDLTTTGATVASMRKYDAWGQYRNDTAPLANEPKLGFTGHQYDPETGLVYARARYYDPEMGRFLSRDSYEGSLTDAPSLHRFAYAWMNPLRYWDRTGFAVCPGQDTLTTHCMVSGAEVVQVAGAEAGTGAAATSGTGAASTGATTSTGVAATGATSSTGVAAAGATSTTAGAAPAAIPWWKVAAASLTAAILGEKSKEMTAEARQKAVEGEQRRISQETKDLLGRGTVVAVEGGGLDQAKAPIQEPGKNPEPMVAPGERGQAGRVITDPSIGAPMVAPGTGDAPVSAPAPEGRDTPLHLAGSGSAQIVYDGKTGRYRDTQTGRFIAQRDLPWPANNGFVSSNTGVVPTGTVIDRFGRPSGRYAGEPGATLSERGLPQGSDALGYHRYEVVKPIPAEIGPAAPVKAFGAQGGGTQYYFQRSIADLVKSGHLREVP